MRWTYVLPALYLALALYAWIDFTRTAQDGLANRGLMLVTLPVAALGLLLTSALGRTGVVLIPDGLGYYTAHGLFLAVGPPDGGSALLRLLRLGPACAAVAAANSVTP